MVRFSFIFGIINFVFVVYALIDCLRTPQTKIRALPKLLWAVIIILFPAIGALIWFILGKERTAPNAAKPAYTTLAPDDDPAFLRKLAEDKQRNQRIQDLEARLSEMDDDPKKPKE